MRALALLVALFVAVGCAKFPDNAGTNNTRLTFTMRVAGEIRSNYVYIVALNFSDEVNPTAQGPIPVVRQPWGNGYVAGTVSHFVRYDPFAFPPTGFAIFRFRNFDLNQPEQIGVPVLSDDVPQGGKTLRFTLDLGQLGLTASEIAALRSVQVNFLTMNRVPTGSDAGGKTLDALGDTRTVSGINEFVVVRLDRSGTVDNSTGITSGLEPANDVIDLVDPDLDIVDWSVRVDRP